MDIELELDEMVPQDTGKARRHSSKQSRKNSQLTLLASTKGIPFATNASRLSHT